MSIRGVTAVDIPDLLVLVKEYWNFEDIAGFDPAAIARQLEHYCEDARLGAGWIASAGNRPVGYLLGVYVFSLEHRGMTAEIDEFFVLPSARGQGIGSTLLDAAEAEFRRAGCTNVQLQLGRGNDAAREYYRRRGYGERAGYELLDKTF